MINKDLLYNNILIRLYMLNPREFKKDDFKASKRIL